MLARLAGAIDLARRSPADLAKRMLVDVDRWLVYSWSRDECAPVPPRPEIDVRRMTDEDLLAFKDHRGRLGEQVRVFVVQRHINTAYGLYDAGRLVHVSWVYTGREYAREPFATLLLADGEVEIKHCVTMEDSRGKGYYPYAIQYLSRAAFDQGVDRVFMTVKRDNTASIHGIVKAGLTRCGTVWRISTMLGAATPRRSVTLRRVARL